MVDYTFWNSNRKCIDGYVYGFAATTKTVTSYANSLYMRSFEWKIVRFNYDNWFTDIWTHQQCPRQQQGRLDPLRRRGHAHLAEVDLRRD